MSIFIRGVDLPENCMDCPVDFPICDLWTHSAFEGIKGNPYYIRHPNCPIIEVPVPHGRLIDADALDDAFTNLRWTTGDYKTGKLVHWGDRKDWCLKGQEVDELINSAPTIIEAEDGDKFC